MFQRLCKRISKISFNSQNNPMKLIILLPDWGGSDLVQQETFKVTLISQGALN